MNNTSFYKLETNLWIFFLDCFGLTINNLNNIKVFSTELMLCTFKVMIP